MENPILMDDLGVPLFRKHPHTLNNQLWFLFSTQLIIGSSCRDTTCAILPLRRVSNQRKARFSEPIFFTKTSGVGSSTFEGDRYLDTG